MTIVVQRIESYVVGVWCALPFLSIDMAVQCGPVQIEHPTLGSCCIVPRSFPLRSVPK